MIDLLLNCCVYGSEEEKNSDKSNGKQQSELG
jgi:hypothetical protein